MFCGLEFAFHSRVPLEGFDYMIGSVHYLDFGGKVLGFDRRLEEVQAYIRDHFGGSGMAFAEKYFDTLCHLPEKGNFDILGHFDLLPVMAGKILSGVCAVALAMLLYKEKTNEA